MISQRFSTYGAVAIAVALVLGSAPAAKAAPITLPTQLTGPMTVVDFNSLSTGTQTSPLVLSGVTFSAGTGGFNTINTSLYQASTLFPTFVSGNALGRADTNPALPNFTITFAAPVAQVGFGIFDANFLGNLILAYDGGGNLLESTSPDYLVAPSLGTGADYVGFVRGAADIKRIELVAGASGGVTDALWIDNLSFSPTPVPEPASLGLVGIGLVAAVSLLRRRKS
jgi:hypothetical protein